MYINRHVHALLVYIRGGLGRLDGNLLCLLHGLLDAADHVECHLGQVVVLATKHRLEALNGFLQADQATALAGEDLGHGEGLGQELLDLACAGHRELVVLRQLVHTQNGNDVLQRLVVLQNLLHTTGNVVVLLADDAGIQNTGGGVEGIDGRVDTELGNLAGKHSGGVQVGESGGGGGIRQIVGRHVHGLHGGNGTLAGGGNALLHTTHVRGQGRLVTHGGGDTAEQGRHLRAGLGEAEDVVNEQQHVLTLVVTEVLGHRQTRQGHTGTGTGGLVHLAVHKGGLGAGLADLDHTRLDHLVVQIVTLACALTDTGEHGETTVGLGNVVDQLHNKHSLADTGTSEQTNLTTTSVGGKHVHDLDTGDEDLLLGGLLRELRGHVVDGQGHLGLNGAALVDGLTDDVDDAPKGGLTHGDADGRASILDLLAAYETLRTVHGNGAHGVLTQVLGDLEHEALAILLQLESRQNGRQLAIELHVHDGTDHSHHAAGAGGSRGGSIAAGEEGGPQERGDSGACEPRQHGCVWYRHPPLCRHVRQD
eukprot:comp18430_c0_seq1/m.19678 comp18430_c0_seq1/g.19678  ORF comp18430_c0_seq1/g.19678 comp18430_c0_seq1/m.19678 type:complete len:536 (+) comp18430_c0_seq1:33-1640(+)